MHENEPKPTRESSQPWWRELPAEQPVQVIISFPKVEADSTDRSESFDTLNESIEARLAAVQAFMRKNPEIFPSEVHCNTTRFQTITCELTPKQCEALATGLLSQDGLQGSITVNASF